LARFKTRFNLNEVVYILKDQSKPEPVIITDIHIHNTTRLHVTYSVTYSGITDAMQKDFNENELGTLFEFKEFLIRMHPEVLEEINEIIDDFKVGDLPKKAQTKEEEEFHSYYPKHLRP
jgi:hypothetical protein